MAKKHKSGAKGVISNAKGDRGAYLGHYRNESVMKHGHNQGAPPRSFNPNPMSDPSGVGATPGVPAQRSQMNAAPKATTEKPVAPVRSPRMTTGVPRQSRDAGMAGRVPRLANDSGMAPGAAQQPMNPRASAAQQALESLRQSVGAVRQSRQSARSILGGVNANKGRGKGKG